MEFLKIFSISFFLTEPRKSEAILYKTEIIRKRPCKQQQFHKIFFKIKLFHMNVLIKILNKRLFIQRAIFYSD